MNYFKLPKVGLRTFKSGLAVFLCLLLIPNEPFFACLTAVICLGDTVTNSVNTGINRGEGFIRACYASSMDNIYEALRRIERFVKEGL